LYQPQYCVGVCRRHAGVSDAPGASEFTTCAELSVDAAQLVRCRNQSRELMHRCMVDFVYSTFIVLQQLDWWIL